MANEPSAAQRKLFAKMGYAMPDGSFYIRPLPQGKTDLENAIRAVGRGEQGGTSGASIRKHIMTRAAALKLSSEIPKTWSADGTLKEAAQDGMTVGELMTHFGVKGMHWGVRKARGPASEDHEQATQIRGKIKDNGGIHALSNDELKTLNERLNLEANYSRLNPEEINAGKKVATNILGNVANQQANKYANKAATAAIDHLISEAGKAHASRKRNAPLRVVSVR